MRIKRFHVPPENILGDTARLSDEEARHLKNVMRIREGEQVEIFDGEGCGYSGEVAFRGDGVSVRGLVKLSTQSSEQPSARLVLALALIKPVRLEWALEKATELGVDEFIPLHTSRSEFRIPPEKVPDRLARWERIVKESAKQCHRLDLLHVRPPQEFRDVCASEEYMKFEKIVFYEQSGELWRPAPSASPVDTVIFIGPVGGWTDEEIDLARKSGCHTHGLGSRILRSETAAIATAAIFRIR